MKNYNGTFLNHQIKPVKASREISNVRPLSDSTGKVRLDCPICGIAFERYACWAKRKKVCYCSKACADEGKRMPVEVCCVVCNGKFFTQPNIVENKSIVTCSSKCSAARKKNLVEIGVSLQNTKKLTRDTGNGNTKLTSMQVAEVEASTEQTSVLAKKFNVSATLIRNIRRSCRRNGA